MKTVFFEGVEYERRRVGRVYRRGPALLIENYGKISTHDYHSISEANYAKRVLLEKLGRRRPS